jgi:aminoglycoside 2''-phosphotransferase
MSTNLLYLSQIRTELRTVQFDKVEYAGGQYNDVVIINQEWVFRFPRHREGVTRMIAETRLLQALRGRLPLPIPDPQFERFEPPVPGLAFVGYRRLPGQPLMRAELDQQQSEWVRGDLAAQLARFLRSLHATPLSELAGAFPNGAAVQDGRPTWEAKYHEVREKLMPAMNPDARREVTAHFEAYLDDAALPAFTPCLRRGDFGGSNILWDPRQGAVTAILDFGFCAPGDPAMDLASVSTLGEDFFQVLLPSYAPDPANRAPLQARARFYRGLFALEEALDGLRLKDAEAYRRGMENYQ